MMKMKTMNLVVSVIVVMVSAVVAVGYALDCSRISFLGACVVDHLENDISYGFYRKTCPRAEQLVQSTVRSFYTKDSKVVPALLRLALHDCFVMGCDAWVLLNGINGTDSEKKVKPNLSLKGFDVIDKIKSRIENECPGTVSCADIVVLAARDAIRLALNHLPKPDSFLNSTLSLFRDHGFGQRETVALLGGHNVGTIHCEFLRKRLTDFNNTGRPDPSIEAGFLKQMTQRCINNTDSLEGSGMPMDKEGTGRDFGSYYYDRLKQGRGILVADQQLMTREETSSWVEAYSSDASIFREDFAQVMIKLSNLQVLTKSQGHIRHNCSVVA